MIYLLATKIPIIYGEENQKDYRQTIKL